MNERAQGSPDHVRSTVHISNETSEFVPNQPNSSTEQITPTLTDESGDTPFLLGNSSAIRKIRSQAEVLARLDVPILIVGESGTGKETVSRLIHRLSSRSHRRFVKISCAASDPDTLEQALFRPEQRSFSGEGTREHTQFLLCNEGTVLLEDVDELPARAQAKLLCLLQDKEFLLDQTKLTYLDVRVVTASKADLHAAMFQGKLRKDLYYYLSAFTILVPPLRERKEDIPLLLKFFMDHVSLRYALPPREFSDSVLLACQQYSWPGNLRELEKFVKQYLVSGKGEATWDAGEITARDETWGIDELLASNSLSLEPRQHSSPAKSQLHIVREEAEREAIIKVLEQTRWNRRAAARLLNVSYRTLLNRIQQYDLVAQTFSSRRAPERDREESTSRHSPN